MEIKDLFSTIILPTRQTFGKAKKAVEETVAQVEQTVAPVKKNVDDFLSNAFGNAFKGNEAQAETKPQNQAQDTGVMQGPDKPKIDIDKLMEAFAYNETRGVEGDKYAFHQPSGDDNLGEARGKYQITDGELADLGEELLGKKVTAQEFQDSPELQEKYMRNKMQAWIDEGLSIEGLAALHRRGYTRYRDEGVVDQKIKDAGGYVTDLVNYYNSL